MSLFRSVVNPKTLVLGGLAVAAVAGALKNRDRVAGLIGARSSEPEPPRPDPGFTPAHEATPAPGEAAPAPAPSNYDLSGPAENTATSLPAPEPTVRGDGGIDEAAEEAAAAAEAAAIGGPTPEYSGRELDEAADDPFRPLAEAGEGEAEGQEQAEADLRDNIEPHAGDPIDAQRRIEDTMDIQGDRTRAEIVEPLPGQSEGGRAEAEQAAVGADEPRGPAEGTPSGPGSGPGGGTQPGSVESGMPAPEGLGSRFPGAGDTADWSSPGGAATVSGGITSGGDVETPDTPAFAAEPGSGGSGETGATETAERAAGAAAGLPDTGGAEAARAGTEGERPGAASVAGAADPAGAGLPDPAGADAATGSDFAGGKTGGDEAAGGAFGDAGASGGSPASGSAGSALGETAAPAGTETPAEQKSAAVWGDQGSQGDPGNAEDDDDGAEWQTWSGNAGRS